MTTFSLEPEQEGSLTLFPQEQGTTYLPDYTDTKSNRFALVLGDANPGPDVINNAISVGDQKRWQEVLKQRQEVENSQRRNDVIREIASTRDPMSAPTPDDIAIVTGLTNDELWAEDVNTILEKKYSDYFTTTVSALEENVVFQDAIDEDPEASLEVLDRVSNAQQRTLIAQDKLEQVNKLWEDAGYFQKGVAFLKGAIPGYDWFKTVDRIEDAPTVSLLTGNNLGEQVAYLYTLPPQQFKETLDKAVDELAEDNLLTAQQFAQAVISYSTWDSSMNNLFDVIDIADVATAGLTSVGKLAKGMAKAGKAITTNPKNVERAAAEVGVVKEAAVRSVVKDTLEGDLTGVQRFSRPDAGATLEERLPSLYAPQRAFTGKSTLESAANNRLRETILRSAELTRDFLSQGRLVDRLEPQQVQMAANEAFDRIKDTFTNVQHHIIDTQVIAAEADTITNTAQAVVKFGKRDGSLFSSEWSAQMFAKKYIGLKTSDYTIEQDGIGGYFVQIKKPVADVGSFRSLEISTELKSADSLSGQFLRNLRSPDYIVSEPQVRARGRVVHTQEFLADYMQKITEPFRGKSKEWRDELEKVLKSNRTNRKYFENIDEFETSFRNINGKAPTEDQAAAYFTYVQLNDLDYLVRDADIVKQKTRLGGERISFKVEVDGKPSVKEFDGVVRENLPYGSKSPYAVVVVNGGKQTSRKSSRFFGETDRQMYDQLISDGYKVVLDPSESTYYLMKEFKRDRIPLGTLNRVEGGHNEYRYNHFIKQADIRTGQDRVSRYRGDKSLFVTTSEGQAREIAELFERARVLVKNKDPNARKFIEDNLPISYGDFIKKTITGDINLDVPIMATRKGQRTADLRDFTKDYEYFDDTVMSEHNVFGSVGGRYTTERADEALDVLLSEQGVIIRSDLEPMLDPLETLRSSTSNMLDVRVVQDYKFKSVQDWVQEFGHLVDAPANKIAQNPMYYLKNAVFRSGANPGQVRVAQNVRNAILALNDYKNPVEGAFHNWRDKLLSSVYDTRGEGWRQFAEDRMFDAKDVQTFLRSAAFNMKLGMFNPKQLFLQASSAVNVVAIAGLKNGTAAARALPLMRFALRTENPDVLRGLHNKFGKLSGWAKDDFLEMIESFKQSGFATISNDVAYLDDFRPKTLGPDSKLGKVWENHTFFFKEGERLARSLAYAAAWREWKDANPGKVFDRFAESKVLSRAKNMTTNMTRDSNAAWQKGWASVATQFMGYQARFMEQLWDGGLLKDGRKLTQNEKGRLMTGMAIMYGFPVFVGSTTAFPARDYIKDWLAEEGLVYDDTMAEPFIDGVMSTVFEAMTGVDMDWSSAYGPNGLPIITDILNQDATWYDLLGGASGGVIIDTIGSTAPALKGIIDMVNPNADSTWPVTAKDLIEPLKNISSANSALRLFEAMNTRRYLSRNGTHLANIELDEAITSALFGVNPDRISDAYSQIAAMQANKEVRRKYQMEAQRNFEKALDAAKRGDFDSFEVYKGRANSAIIRGGLTFQESIPSFRRALEERPLDQTVYENFEREVIRRRKLMENN